MKKFQFRLEPLLKVRSEIEKRKQRELAEVHRLVLLQQQKIEATEQEKLATQNSQRTGLGSKITLSEMLVYTRYYMKLKRQKISEKEMLRILDIDVEKKRQALLAASIERKKYEKLREIQNQKYLIEFHSKEAKQFDEFGRISHFSKATR